MAAVQDRLREGVTVGGVFEMCVKEPVFGMFENVTKMKWPLLTSKGLSSVCILMCTLKVEL